MYSRQARKQRKADVVINAIDLLPAFDEEEEKSRQKKKRINESLVLTPSAQSGA